MRSFERARREAHSRTAITPSACATPCGRICWRSSANEEWPRAGFQSHMRREVRICARPIAPDLRPHRPHRRARGRQSLRHRLQVQRARSAPRKRRKDEEPAAGAALLHGRERGLRRGAGRRVLRGPEGRRGIRGLEPQRISEERARSPRAGWRSARARTLQAAAGDSQRPRGGGAGEPG